MANVDDRARFPYFPHAAHPMPAARMPARPRLSAADFHNALYDAVYAEIAREDERLAPLAQCSPEVQERVRAQYAAEARALCAWLRNTIGIVDMDSLLERSSDLLIGTVNRWEQLWRGRLPNDGKTLAARAVGILRREYDAAVRAVKKEWRREVEARGHSMEEPCEACISGGASAPVDCVAADRSGSDDPARPRWCAQGNVIFVGYTPAPRQSVDDFLFFDLPALLADPASRGPRAANR